MIGPLAPVVEFVLMGAMLAKDIAVEDLEPKTLSHTGQKIWRAAQSLKASGGDFDEHGVLVTAVEVYGLDKGRLEEYMSGVRKHETKNAAGVYDLLKRRQALIAISNEIQSQLGSGNLDLERITSHIASSAAGKTDLTSIEDDLADGAPLSPSGPSLRSLPKLSDSVHGLHGMWLVAGITGIGKSTLANQIVTDGAREMPVLIYDFENSRRVLLYRQVENFGLETARRIGKRMYIRESLRTLNKDLAKFPPPAIIMVDSIQRVPVHTDDHLAGLNNWINRFEELKQRGYIVVLVSEINRAHYTGSPTLDCFKDSGRLEYACTYAVVLQEADGGLLRPHVVKNRHYPFKGPLGLLERSKPWWFKEVEISL